MEERFSGDGAIADDERVEKVLLFVRHDRAYWLEQELHGLLRDDRLFPPFSRVDYMPLYRNGQSELYAKDVLQLDDEFRADQERSSRERMRQRTAAEHAKLPKPPLSSTVTVAVGEVIGFVLSWLVMRPVLLLLHPWLKRQREAARASREREQAQHRADVTKMLARIRELQQATR